MTTGPTTHGAAPGKREQWLFLAAVAAIGLHVADDNFFQPQPGTSASDHLVSGLVPLALLALAAWGYPRLRAGARAVVALALGVFGLVLGIEAVYYALNGGLAGDDYTGLLAMAAGLALVGLAGVTLWRSRRTDDTRRRRYLRRTLLVVGGLAAAYIVVLPLSVAYVVTHTARAVVPAAELDAEYEEVAFTTADGLELHGWYVPSKNRAAVIVFPGRKGPQRQTRVLARHGYGVLLFDRRGEGESEGDPNAFGWSGTKDLEAAVAFLRTRSDVEPVRIGGVGLSVGGEMLLQAAAESDDFAAIVSEGAGIRSLREALAVPQTRQRIEASIAHAVVTPGVALFANTLPPPSLEDLVSRISEPVFFIYAEPGQGGEAELTRPFYDAANEPKAIWLVPGASHTGGIEAAPAEYERRIVEFFDAALLDPAAER